MGMKKKARAYKMPVTTREINIPFLDDEPRPLTMMEDLIDDYTFLHGTKDAVKELVKDMLAFIAEDREYTAASLYMALKTKPAKPPMTILGFPVVECEEAIQVGSYTTVRIRKVES